MILVDSSATDSLTFKFTPKVFPVLDCGSALITVTDEQTGEVFTYDRSPIMTNKYWMEATISRSDFVATHNYTVTIYMYEDDNPLLFEGKMMCINFTEKGYTEGVNQN